MYFAYITAQVHQMIMQQWHATTTTRHSYTHISFLVSPDVWLGLELLPDIQFGLPTILRAGSRLATQHFWVRFTHQWLNLPFLNF